VWSRLSRRAYAIFIIHPPVLVAVAMAWNAVAAPPLLKFAITGSIACALCYGIAGLLVGAPGLRHLI
jgi:peptidoglycan/LPS O-acetylase OafA/YrhL